MGAWGKVILGSWLGWRQGEQRGDPVQPERRWASQVGHCLGPEGEKVFARQGKRKELYSSPWKKQPGGKLAFPWNIWKGKPHKNFLPQWMQRGRVEVRSKFLSGEVHPASLLAHVWLL